jgi:hypothetical protein
MKGSAMLKNLVALFTFSLAAACAENDKENVPAPAPTPVPLVDAATAQILVEPKVLDEQGLPEGYGFTATYSGFGRDFIRFDDGETIVKISGNHVQLRHDGDREILDCMIHPDSLPSMRYVVEGRQERLDTLMAITCTNMIYLASPIINVDELCQAYQCVDEKLRGFETIKVLMKEPLWIEKETHIRVQSSDGLQMTSKTRNAPSLTDFAFPLLP